MRAGPGAVPFLHTVERARDPVNSPNSSQDCRLITLITMRYRARSSRASSRAGPAYFPRYDTHKMVVIIRHCTASIAHVLDMHVSACDLTLYDLTQSATLRRPFGFACGPRQMRV